MDRPFDTLDRHFQLPEVSRGLPLSRPLHWLRSAWDDLRHSPVPSLAYGLFFAFAGGLVLAFAADRPYLFSAAISGFLLMAPLLLSGLYEISRRRAAGKWETTISDSMLGYRRNGQSLFLIGVLLAVIAIGWERISAILFALLYGGTAPDLGQIARDVFLSGDYLRLALTWTLLGGTLAAVVFGITAVSMPMIVDRDVDAITAMMTSLRAVVANLLPMVLWAGLIVALTAVGFATFLVGLVVILPLLGHATWHAYRDLVH